jgi:hypothetical protein
VSSSLITCRNLFLILSTEKSPDSSTKSNDCIMHKVYFFTVGSSTYTSFLNFLTRSSEIPDWVRQSDPRHCNFFLRSEDKPFNVPGSQLLPIQKRTRTSSLCCCFGATNNKDVFSGARDQTVNQDLSLIGKLMLWRDEGLKWPPFLSDISPIEIFGSTTFKSI